MTKRAAPAALVALGLDPSSPLARNRQLYEALRESILAGQLRAGARLPSTRVLAADLGCSRNTVLAAFEQLTAEGYLEARIGAGTTVARTLPDTLLRVHPGAAVPRAASSSPGPRRHVSRRAALAREGQVSRWRTPAAPRPFRPGLPALDAFPTRAWSRIMAGHWRRADATLLDYGDPAGYRPLRAAIAGYLREARAVRCETDQVIVVSGTQQGLDLAARIVLDPGETAWIEDPCYPGARGALAAAEARSVPVPVDDEGLDVRAGARLAPRARLVYVTPSHQYPLGITMSLRRRLALLAWANRSGAWILEDDYDSEYRYRGRPLAALQGLDSGRRVIYLGTFSKILFPALRLGYLVVPPDLVDTFVAARSFVDRHPAAVPQAALAEFITDGHFASHLRRTRPLYEERQAALIAASRQMLSGLLEMAPSDAGMHLVGWLPARRDDRAASRAASAAGIEAPPLSSYRLRTRGRGGLILGYAGFDARAITEGVGRLADALGRQASSGQVAPGGSVAALTAARRG